MPTPTPAPEPSPASSGPKPVTRRTVISTVAATATTTLATGFALAVRPVSAATITTDTAGLLAGEVKIPAQDGGEIPAYRAQPDKGGPFPVVLVVQEIFGVHEHIKDVCRRLAKLGYLAVAPELYARQGDVSKIQDIQQIISTVVSKVPDKQVLADLDAAVSWAKSSGHGDTSKLAITGFCWGGRIVWLYAAHNPDLKAGVAWYGRLDSPKDDLHPTHPLDLVGELKAPVLGLYGGADSGIPNDLVAKMQEKLRAAKKPARFSRRLSGQLSRGAGQRRLAETHRVVPRAWSEMTR
jgi:carboxymethylenebutenolidase